VAAPRAPSVQHDAQNRPLTDNHLLGFKLRDPARHGLAMIVWLLAR
jgi:hypothetical protein